MKISLDLLQEAGFELAVAIADVGDNPQSSELCDVLRQKRKKYRQIREAIECGMTNKG